MSMNSEIFLPHMNEKHGTTTVMDYCTAMSNDGVWGTDIKILALATILQWLRYLPLSPFNVTMIKHLSNYFTWTSQRTFI